MRQSDKFTNLPSAARGLVNRQQSARHFQLRHYQPVAELAHLVVHFWQVSWDLRGQPDYVQQNLPHPSVHLSLESGGFCGIRGVVSRCFRYRLSGQGRVLGVKFHPAAFSAFHAEPAHRLTDKRLAIHDLWGESESRWQQRLVDDVPVAEMIAGLEALLLKRAGPLPAPAEQARLWVEAIADEPGLCSLSVLADRGGVSVRSLQRLFREYVGVSPKWVMDRYRMIEAVETINAGGKVDLTDLAYRLGYSDQAHFSKAFAALVGVPPSRV